MNYSLNSFKGVFIGDYIGNYYRAYLRDTKSLDYGLYIPWRHPLFRSSDRTGSRPDGGLGFTVKSSG